MHGRVVLVLTCSATLLLAACTNVPTSSAPEVVRAVEIGAPPAAPPAVPTPGEQPRGIVTGFLQDNAAGDVNHSSARAFLAQRQKTGWRDTSLTVVDRITVGNARDEKDDKVVDVEGRQIGTVDYTQQPGVYTPALRGDGSGGALVRDTLKLRKEKGEWRITSLDDGLLITESAFETSYHQYGVYFMDPTDRHLVPEARYLQADSSQAAAEWLVDALVIGPTGAPQNGLSNLLPNQPAGAPTVRFADDGAVVKVEITGATSLSVADRNRVAAELGATLGQVNGIQAIEVTDGGRPVTIPAVASAQFAPSALSQLYTVTSAGATPNLYFVRQHVVYDSNGIRVPGRLEEYGLTSVDLSTRSNGTVQAAGVRAEGHHEVLDVGTSARLYRTSILGALSRPAWAPDVDEVWVGADSSLYRVSMPSRTVHRVQLDVPRGSATGTVVAVRLSPDGSRVAMVLRSRGTSQIYVGAIVRRESSVRVANLAPISPQAVEIQDVAWNDEFKLFAIGSDKLVAGWGLWEMQADGSLWTERSNSGLPQAPSSLTVASGSVAVVSAGNTVWQQQASAWESLSGDETFGRNPIYAE